MESRTLKPKKIFDGLVNCDRPLDSLSYPLHQEYPHAQSYPPVCLHALSPTNTDSRLSELPYAQSPRPSSRIAACRFSPSYVTQSSNIPPRLLRALVKAPGFWNSLVMTLSTGSFSGRPNAFSFGYSGRVLFQPPRNTVMGCRLPTSSKLCSFPRIGKAVPVHRKSTTQNQPHPAVVK